MLYVLEKNKKSRRGRDRSWLLVVKKTFWYLYRHPFVDFAAKR
jgi:hypothetical protein